MKWNEDQMMAAHSLLVSLGIEHLEPYQCSYTGRLMLMEHELEPSQAEDHPSVLDVIAFRLEDLDHEGNNEPRRAITWTQAYHAQAYAAAMGLQDLTIRQRAFSHAVTARDCIAETFEELFALLASLDEVKK